MTKAAITVVLLASISSAVTGVRYGTPANASGQDLTPKTVTVTSAQSAVSVQVTATGATATSPTAGGAVNVNCGANTGACLDINHQAGANNGRALNVYNTNAAFNTSLAHFESSGTAGTVDISQDDMNATWGLNVVSQSTMATAMGVQGHEAGHGTIKSIHEAPGDGSNDAAASAFDARCDGNLAANVTTTACKMFFADSFDSHLEGSHIWSTGDLFDIRNNGLQFFVMTASGAFVLNGNNTPSGMVDIRGVSTPMVSGVQDNIPDGIFVTATPSNGSAVMTNYAAFDSSFTFKTTSASGGELGINTVPSAPLDVNSVSAAPIQWRSGGTIMGNLSSDSTINATFKAASAKGIELQPNATEAVYISTSGTVVIQNGIVTNRSDLMFQVGVSSLQVSNAGNTYFGTNTGTQMYRCSGGTDAGWILYGNSGAAQTLCTGGGGSVVALPIFVP